MKAFDSVGRSKMNSFDLLRLVAATMVLYSHQFALLGMPEPSFFAWNTFGGAGVTIFFFLSGMLVWSSWNRDPDWFRFFQRRSLRIFPALWLAVVLTVLLLGPIVSTLPWRHYFGSMETWRYFTTAALLNQHTLPGVFKENFYPRAVNGSLWTLPVEFLCYASVAVVGGLRWAPKGSMISVSLLIVVLLASLGPLFSGARFQPHFEMIAVFWWGVTYGYFTQTVWRTTQDNMTALLLVMLSFLFFAFVGERGFDRMAMLVSTLFLVHGSRSVSVGGRLTDSLGDLSYGMYIFAFPVQQMVVHWGRGQNWSMSLHFYLSLLITSLLAYVSWHVVESRALLHKPKNVSRFKVSVL